MHQASDGWRGERFYFLMAEEGCLGFDEGRAWTVREWLDNQGIEEYDVWGEQFKELTLHKFFEDGGVFVSDGVAKDGPGKEG